MLRQYAPVPGTARRSPGCTSAGRNSSFTTMSPDSQCFPTTRASYGAASLAHASGFLAVYVAALVLGNVRLPHGPATRGFAEGVAWLAQIGLFVMLGLLASPARLPEVILPALAVAFVLIVLARPLAVLVSVLPLRVPWRWR